MGTLHDCVTQLSELFPIQSLGEEVPDHLGGWTIFDCDVSSPLNIGRKKLMHFYVPCSLAA
jgi:hypothetical protein